MVKYLSTFHHGVEEIALIAHPQSQGNANEPSATTVELKSYVDPNKTQNDESLHAMISIYNTLPFASYSNSLESVVEIIFNIKDFKAMLTLSETIRTNIELSFIGPSQPLVVISHFNDEFGAGTVKARLVVSTIDNPYSTPYSEQEQAGVNSAGRPPPRRQQQREENEDGQAQEDYGEFLNHFFLLLYDEGYRCIQYSCIGKKTVQRSNWAP